jgi:hypothetical protein
VPKTSGIPASSWFSFWQQVSHRGTRELLDRDAEPLGLVLKLGGLR